MKIVHLSTAERTGGAAIAAGRLNNAMQQMGIDSTLLVLRAQGYGAQPINRLYTKLFAPIFNRITTKLTPATKPDRGTFSWAALGLNPCKHPLVQQADVVYIHWINGSFLSLKSINQLCKTGKQIIVFMHDMWHCTGGCHYSFECDRFTGRCTDCPMFVSTRHTSLASKQQKLKIKLFEKYDTVRVVTPSGWLTQCAGNSSVFAGKRISTIPNTLDVSLYKPTDKAFARAMLNLPTSKKIVCFGADIGTKNPYKGWSYLQEALSLLKDETDVEVLVFGSAYDAAISAAVPFPVHYTGRLYDDYSLALIYNAINLFVTPSLAEAFGQVASEAMACGVPVVGFDVGGIPDLIDHRNTGYLARYKDVGDLAEGIRFVLHTDQYDRLSHNGLAKVREMCRFEVIVNQHKALWA